MSLRQREKIQEVLRRLRLAPTTGVFSAVQTSPLLPFISAVFSILSFPPFAYLGVAWIAWAPLALFACHAPRRGFMWGWAAGTLAYTGILWWIVTTFRVAGLSMAQAGAALFALAAYLGLYWGAWVWIVSRIHRGPIGRMCGGPCAWVALEYARTHLFSGFPWTLVGDSQYRALPLIQIARVTGVYGVSFLVILFNVALTQGRAAWRLALVILLAALFFGRYHLNSAQDDPSGRIRVALLQGNIDQYKKWDAAYVADIERTYETLAMQAASSLPALIVWPETSVPGYLLQDPPLWTWLSRLVLRTKDWNLVGTPLMRQNEAFNSAFVINPDGTLGAEYDKIHLVPFGEVVPWSGVLGRFIHVLNELGGFTSGQRSSVLPVNAWFTVGVSICYEAIFPDLVRRSVKAGAQILVNITNDGWYMRTAEPWQHFIPNIFRAVENDRWLVRADNTGISAIVSPVGRITAQSGIFTKEYVTGSVYSRSDLMRRHNRDGVNIALLKIPSTDQCNAIDPSTRPGRANVT